MRYRNNKARVCAGLTLIEMVIAMAIMVVVLAVIVPQFRAILNSWDSKAGAAETLQNGRVLIDHLNRNLSKAVKITDVSDSNQTKGYIEFQDNDGNTLKYGVDANNYVEFGLIGSLYELAGPVSQFQFTCYDACDFNAPLSSPIDVDIIRLVEAETILTNSATLGQDKTFTASVYLRTNWNSSSGCDPNLVGWWKLDETSGLTAADSSGNGNDGNLVNMVGDEWTTGHINGALEFAGSNDDGVDCGNDSIFDITNEITLSAWVKTNDCGNSDHNPYIVKGDYSYGLKHTDTNELEFYIKGDGDTWYLPHYAVDGSFNGTWHHLAGTYDGSQVKLYVDGVLEDTEDFVGSIETDTTHLYIGEEIERTYRYYDGVIDDVRIYNRALSAHEVAQLAEAVVYIDFEEAKVGSDAESITISTPDTNEGDLLIAAVATDGSTTISPPSGWTLINCGTYSSEVTLAAWWKIADASEPTNHTFTWSGAEQAYGWMMRFVGHDSTPINAWATNGETSSTPTSPAVTTTVDNCLILRLGGFDDGDVNTLPEPGNPGLSGHTPITMDESAATGLTGGLTGDYYDNDDFTNLMVTRTDPTVDFDWGNGAPDPSMGEDTFSVRWTGYVKPLYSETYTFKTFSDDGDRVWVDNQLLIDDWGVQHGPKTHEGTIALTAGQMYDIKVEFYEGTGGAEIYLYWSSLSQAEEIIPQSQLYIVGGGGSGGTVSGGAGYVMQSASGDSGTSTFLLTASEESRTLTIAIAPDPNSGGGCGSGEILP